MIDTNEEDNMLRRWSITGMLIASLAIAACEGSPGGNEAGQRLVPSTGQVTTTSGSEMPTPTQPQLPTTTRPERPAGTEPETPTSQRITVGRLLEGETVPLAGVRRLEASGGLLWAWGEDEIWRYNADGWSPYFSAPPETSDLAYDGDTLWAATGSGLRHLEEGAWVEVAASPSDLRDVEATPGTGVVFGLAGGELYRWDGDEMINVGSGPADYYLTNIVGTEDGSVWASGNFWGIFGGLARYDDVTSSWEVVRLLVGDEDIPAFGLATTPDGSLWVLLGELLEESDKPEREGEPVVELVLARRNGATGEWAVYAEHLSEGVPVMMAADADGVWLTQGSRADDGRRLAGFDGRAWTHYPAAEPVTDVAVAPDGTIWTTTDRGDLRRLHPMPAAALSAPGLRQWRVRAQEIGDGYWGAWPDTAIVEELADDVVFSMPSDGDLIEGKGAVGSMLRTFIGYYAAAEPAVEAMFLSADAAAYHVSFASGLWPPWTPEPLVHPPFTILDIFRFTDGAITDYEVWLEDKTLQMAEYGCFAIDGCLEAQALVDRYMAAWSAGDVDDIAALYADNAVFTDSLLGLHAVGPGAISGLVDERYGSGDFTVELLGVYGQTNGYQSPTDESPELGRLVGIGIHYRVSDEDTGVIVLESLTTFELGHWQPGSSNRNPRGLITREEVFHEPDTFLRLSK